MQADVWCPNLSSSFFFHSHDCDLFSLTEWSAFIAVLNFLCGVFCEMGALFFFVFLFFLRLRTDADLPEAYLSSPLETGLLAATQKNVSI